MIEKLGRMDVLLDECPRRRFRYGANADRLWMLVEGDELAVGDVEGGPFAAPQGKPPHLDAGVLRNSFRKMVPLPVVLEGSPAGGQDLDAVAARREPRGHLEGVLFRSSDQVAAEPGDDERSSNQGRRP